MYNKTQLNPETTFERHVFHRDQFAHYLRWTHVLKRAEIGSKILDVGCGSGNLCEVFYRNRFKPSKYLGLDIRKQVIEKANQKFGDLPWAKFKNLDIVKDIIQKEDWDFICSFEVMEHVGKQNVQSLLNSIKEQMSEKTIFLMSTPCYDEKVGAADNHTFDSGDGRGVAIQEFTYKEMKDLLEEVFIITNHWGTFASVRDYKPYLPEELKPYYEKWHEYFDPNILSNLMAPLFPDKSRNVLWECKLKDIK